MQVDASRLGVIGIDRIVINNFKILNFGRLEKKEIINDLEYVERFEVVENGFRLVYSDNLKSTGEIYSFSSLEFNANKFSENHNIYNSTISDITNCLEKILFFLKSKGIRS